MITYILRFIFLLMIFFFVKKLFFSLFGIGQKPREKVPRNAGQEKRMIKKEQVEKDPVCGMFVAREAAVVVESGEFDYYFCSEECRDKFLEGLKS